MGSNVPMHSWTSKLLGGFCFKDTFISHSSPCFALQPFLNVLPCEHCFVLVKEMMVNISKGPRPSVKINLFILMDNYCQERDKECATSIHLSENFHAINHGTFQY